MFAIYSRGSSCDLEKGVVRIVDMLCAAKPNVFQQVDTKHVVRHVEALKLGAPC
jgi:hypothetical protein